MKDGNKERLLNFKRRLAVFVVAGSLAVLITAPPEVASIRSKELAARYDIPLAQTGFYPDQLQNQDNAATMLPDLVAAKRGCVVATGTATEPATDEDIRRSVRKCEAFVKVASDMASCKWYRPIRQGEGREMLLSDLAPFKEAATALANEGEVLANDGQGAAAIDKFSKALAMNDLLKDQPDMIYLFSWVKTYKKIVGAIGDHLPQIATGQKNRRRLGSMFENVYRPDAARALLLVASSAARDSSKTCHLNAQIFRGSVDREPESFSLITLADLKDNWSRIAWGPFVVERWGRLLQRVRLAPTDYDNFAIAEQEFSKAVVAPPMPGTFEPFLLPEFGGLATGFKEVVATQELTRSGFQAIASSSLPDVSSTMDPLSGHPYRVKHINGGWLVYSVGRDKHDDNGLVPAKEDKSSDPSDIVFTWDGKNASL